MPRPGPRPYECVRRAWHSDRHQPTRGSIIQQIFKLVKESHSPTTTKKKEWQEKLPFVVLKAEEIMYSKANSEAEYTNLDTLWDRVNDAVDTIIKRDESTETGEHLPPCVEAALNLGCVPVRASRSQRHILPRNYLPRVQEQGSAPPKMADRSTDEQCPQLSPVQAYCPRNYARATTNINSTCPVSESNGHVTESCNLPAPHSYPFPYENVSSGHNRLMTLESNNPLNLGSVYPLYYGNQLRKKDNQLGSVTPEKVNSNTIFVGTPIGTSMPEAAGKSVLQNFFSCPAIPTASKRVRQPDFRHSGEKRAEMECDLNLSLALSPSCQRIEQGMGYETADGLSVSSQVQERYKYNDISFLKHREFTFFPGNAVGDPSDSCSSRRFLDGGSQNLDASARKRKAPFGDNTEDGQFCWQSKLPSS